MAKATGAVFAPKAKTRIKNYLIAPGNIVLVFVMLAFCLIAGSAGDFALSTAVYNPANLYAQFIATFGMLPFPLAFSAAGVLFFCACDRKRVPSFVFYLCFGIALNVAALVVMGSEFWSNLGAFMQQGQEVPLYATGPVFFACISALPICIFDLWLVRICEGVEKKCILRVAWFICFAVATSDILINSVLKELWCRPRFRMIVSGAGPTFQPWWHIGFPEKAFYLAQGVGADEFRSFPSGHTACAGYIFFICALPYMNPSLKRYRSFYFWLSVVVVACVMVGRIIAGAHFLTDVTAAATVDVSVFLIGIYLFFKNKLSEKNSK